MAYVTAATATTTPTSMVSRALPGRSRRGVVDCISPSPERGDRCRGGESPVLVTVGVEPYEPEQPVGPDAGEQVGDLRRLVCPRRADLRDEYRDRQPA